MEHIPGRSQQLDFEIGAFGDKLKKLGKTVSKGIDKVTDATITKPTVAIMGAVGGKKGKELGKKIGGIASKVTKVATIGGAVAGAAPALLPLATSPAGIAVGAKLIKDKVAANKKAKPKATAKPEAAAKPKSPAAAPIPKAGACPNTDSAEAAKIGAQLVAKFGGPLGKMQKAIKLAAIQREATSEHNRLMKDSEFRKTVLSSLATMAKNGDVGCQRTIRVLIGR